MKRAVIDTNVLVSGIIQKNGFPYKVIRLWEDNGFILITSPPMLEEADRVLRYRKIKERFKLKDSEIKKVVSNLLRYSVVVSADNAPAVINDDPEDNKVLATAVEGRADYLVTGDFHLLKLGNYAGIDIITPRMFCVVMG